MRSHKSYGASDLYAWLEKPRQEKTKTGQVRWKQAQIEMMDIIIQRMATELADTRIGTAVAETKAKLPKSDPLLWLLHGGPGTGKSEVLKLVQKMFRDVC